MLLPEEPSPYVFKSTILKGAMAEALEFFESVPENPLPPTVQISQGGVYALYYVGKSHKPYSCFADLNKSKLTVPIYVGKAVPRGWRTGRAGPEDSGSVLGRLREHAGSIAETTSLKLTDFRSRFVIMGGLERDLIVPLESELIRLHKPLWNGVIAGFGNHYPGGGRLVQAPSEWDIYHPGRSWVSRLTGKPPDLDFITEKVKRYCKELKSRSP